LLRHYMHRAVYRAAQKKSGTSTLHRLSPSRGFICVDSRGCVLETRSQYSLHFLTYYLRRHSWRV